MDIQVNHAAGKTSTLKVSDALLDQPYNEALIHQVVVAHMAGSRQGSHKQKTRSEVRGGGKKPWRQKGTGNARAGTIRSPIWRGGGVTFASKPRDYSQKVNKKMYKAAMRAILSELNRQNRLKIVENFELAEPKTKLAKVMLAELGVEKALLILDEMQENIYLGTRNLPYIAVSDAQGVDPVNLIRYPVVVITAKALEQFEEIYA